jgi:hypothetical protein
MRNLILAIVITLWGAGIVFGRMLGATDTGSGAYGFGQNLAFILGIVMVAAGTRAIVKHLNARA